MQRADQAAGTFTLRAWRDRPIKTYAYLAPASGWTTGGGCRALATRGTCGSQPPGVQPFPVSDTVAAIVVVACRCRLHVIVVVVVVVVVVVAICSAAYCFALATTALLLLATRPT